MVEQIYRQNVTSSFLSVVIRHFVITSSQGVMGKKRVDDRKSCKILPTLPPLKILSGLLWSFIIVLEIKDFICFETATGSNPTGSEFQPCRMQNIF